MSRIEIYDTTLRDGAQGLGVAFSLVDKLRITEHLDTLGVDYVEGGYPLSNPKDAEYFQQVKSLPLTHTKVCAFGMTRRRGLTAEQDEGMQALVQAGTPVITLVGKSWDLHVDEVLRVSREENLDMIGQSVAYCARHAEVFYDAEHFFDGYRANPDYALATLLTAAQAGATRLILCDTNGGTLPAFVTQVIQALKPTFLERGLPFHAGIHPHNDAGLAVAVALAGVEAGCVQVQGTINGIGERCGNVDLTTVAANLALKMGHDLLLPGSLARLTETSRFVYGVANLNGPVNQPYTGRSAFAHKGGMHVHAVRRIAHSYEHTDPATVGNERLVLVSELSGASNIAATLGAKFNIEQDRELQRKVLTRVQDLENAGYEFEDASGSFELLLHEAMNTRPSFFTLDHYRCTILKRDGDRPTTEAIVRVNVRGQDEYRVAEGDGPVNALDAALRKGLQPHYPAIDRLRLRDFKVRVVNAREQTAAKVRVVIQFADRDHPTRADFGTIGVSENIVDASWQALTDAVTYHLIQSSASQPHP